MASVVPESAKIKSFRTSADFVCLRSHALADRRRQKKYENPQSTPVPAAKPHASGPSPTAKWAVSADRLTNRAARM
jgi:hypothetical protein